MFVSLVFVCFYDAFDMEFYFYFNRLCSVFGINNLVFSTDYSSSMYEWNGKSNAMRDREKEREMEKRKKYDIRFIISYQNEVWSVCNCEIPSKNVCFDFEWMSCGVLLLWWVLFYDWWMK